VPRVLLVDDDIAEISAVKRVLARAGHQALLATNAADALGTIGRAPPAALVVASSCEGGEALRRLAEDGVAGALPLLVLGETPDAPAGAAQLARPVDPEQLAERLAAALGGAASPAPPLAPPPAVAPGPADRRAAADALRARAEELRRGAVTSALPAAVPAPARPAAPQRRRAAPAPPPPPPPPEPELEAPVSFGEAPAGDDLGLGLGLGLDLADHGHEHGRETPVSFGEEAPAPTDGELSFGLDDGGAAAHALDGDAHADADAALAELEAPSSGAEPARLDLDQDPGLEAILRRAEQAEARARAEADARRAEEEAAARAAAEEEAQRAEEHRRRAEEEARRAAEAEARAGRERQARESADRELQRLRRELEEERRAAEERARTVAEAARAEEEGSRRRAEAEEEQLRAAIRSARAEMEALRKRSGAEEGQLRAAIESARAEMDALRKRGEEEARKRAAAEAEAARLARDAEAARAALEAERDAVESEAARRADHAERRARDAEERAAEAERAVGLAAGGAAAPPPEPPIYRPPPADPAPDPAQESARRRVAALRERAPSAASPAAIAAPPQAPAPVPDDEPPRAPVRPPPAELRAGTLAELPAPRLLALAARARLGGRLDLEGGAARSLYFDAGRIVGATSSAPAERVEEVALRLGLVTRDQHRIVAASAAPLATRRAAVLLLERGFLKPNELAPLVRRRTEEVVFGVFGDAGARFRWSAAEVPTDESTALERTTLQLAVEGVRRRWLAPELDGVLGGEATLLAPVPNGPSAADLALAVEDRRVLALADGLRTLDEIVAASPLDPLSTRQLLAALVLVGALAVRTFQGGRPAAAASAAIDLARVRDKLEQVRRADYFTVLGLGRLCTPHEVRDAHERLRAEFDPRRFHGVREDGLDGRLEEILRVVEDARDVLADDFLRAEYLRGLGE
jgi:CheY-like chemotaxis protein